MKILSTSKKYLKWFGVLPIPGRAPTIHFIHTVLFSVGLLLYLSTLGHFLIFKAKSPVIFFISAFFFTVTLMRSTLYFLMLWVQSKLFVLVDDIEEEVNRRSEDLETRQIYLEEIEKSEKFANKFFNFLIVFATIFPSVKVVESYYRFYALHNGAASFKPLMPATWPFNWKTPKGYMFAACIQTVWLVAGAAIVLSIILVFSGVCDVLGAFCIDIVRKFADFNRVVVEADHKFTASNRIRIATEFHAIIEFHSKVKQFTVRFTAAYSFILTALFGISTPSICMALLNMNTTVDSGHFVDVVRSFVLLTFVLVYIIFVCMTGDRVTTRFDEVNASIWECSLTDFPIEIQKNVPMILAIMQKPVYIEGFMNVQCTREVLQAIINGSFSYFSLLRGVSQ